MSHGYSRTRWDNFVHSSRGTENKGVTFIFLQASPCGGLWAASTGTLFGFCVCIYNLFEMWWIKYSHLGAEVSNWPFRQGKWWGNSLLPRSPSPEFLGAEVFPSSSGGWMILSQEPWFRLWPLCMATFRGKASLPHYLQRAGLGKVPRAGLSS